MDLGNAIYTSKKIISSLTIELQDLKDFKISLMGDTKNFPEKSEAIAQCTLSQRDLESAILRQEMVLKTLEVEDDEDLD